MEYMYNIALTPIDEVIFCFMFWERGYTGVVVKLSVRGILIVQILRLIVEGLGRKTQNPCLHMSTRCCATCLVYTKKLCAPKSRIRSSSTANRPESNYPGQVE